MDPGGHEKSGGEQGGFGNVLLGVFFLADLAQRVPCGCPCSRVPTDADGGREDAIGNVHQAFLLEKNSAVPTNPQTTQAPISTIWSVV